MSSPGLSGVTLTGGPWTNYIKGPIGLPHFEFTEEFIIIKVLTKIIIKHKTMMKCEVKSNFIIKAKLSVYIHVVNYCNFNYCKYTKMDITQHATGNA